MEAGIDLPRFAVVTPFPNTPLYKRLDAEGRILTKTGSSTTRSTSSFSRAHERRASCKPASRRRGSTPTVFAPSCAASAARPRPGRCGSARISATVFTRTISAASTTATGSSGARRLSAPLRSTASSSAGRLREMPAFTHETDDHSSVHRPPARASRYIRTWQMEPLARRDARGAHAARRGSEILRRPDGDDPVRRADRSRGDERGDLHRPSAPTRSPANTAAAACRWSWAAFMRACVPMKWRVTRKRW